MSEISYPGGKVRLYVEAALARDAEVPLAPAQSHYLLHVMRAKAGDRVSLFNGRDGEWLAELTRITKRDAGLTCRAQTGAQSIVPDLWFAFAPIKRMAAEFVVQKATELGVRRLIPVVTQRTIVRRVNGERLAANAVEASEQSARRDIPEIAAAVSLEALLGTWPQERRLLFCDEAGEAVPIASALTGAARGPWGILVGPEGGFDPGERARIRAHPACVPVTLGGRILRADTAGLAALAVWQSLLGDWG